MSRVGRRLVFALVSMAALSLLTLVALGSDQTWGGPVLLTIAPGHGLHLGDIPILLIWAAGMVASVAQVPDSWRRDTASSPAGEPAEPVQR